MIYLKPFNEGISEDYIIAKIFEINGDIIEDIELCFIDLIDNGIIKKIDGVPIVDRQRNNDKEYTSQYRLTLYFNIFFYKDVDISEYFKFKQTRFLELFSIMFPNYIITSTGASNSDSYDFKTRNCDTIKVISKIPFNI